MVADGLARVSVLFVFIEHCAVHRLSKKSWVVDSWFLCFCVLMRVTRAKRGRGMKPFFTGWLRSAVIFAFCICMRRIITCDEIQRCCCTEPAIIIPPVMRWRTVTHYLSCTWLTRVVQRYQFQPKLSLVLLARVSVEIDWLVDSQI